MPELPEVEQSRRDLLPAMRGARFDSVVAHRADLRIPFPENFSARLTQQTVIAVRRRAKYLLAELSSGDTLIMHLGMSGSFRVEWDRGTGGRRAASDPVERGPHDHVVFRMSSGATVTFNDPRRFGVMDLVATATLADHGALGALGPEPLSTAFDAAALALACKRRKTPIKVALLDQRVVSGLGNIYASEALHVARLRPTHRASTIATPSGLPRPAAVRLTAAIKQVLTKAIERQTTGAYRGARFRVYGREGEPCRRAGCTGVIRSRTQANRSTFYCPVCQR